MLFVEFFIVIKVCYKKTLKLCGSTAEIHSDQDLQGFTQVTLIQTFKAFAMSESFLYPINPKYPS